MTPRPHDDAPQPAAATPPADRPGPATLLPPVVHDLAERALELARLVHQVSDAQWSRAPRLSVDTMGRRATGGHGDPTFDVVADEGRLALRGAVQQSYRALEQAVIALRTTSASLERALAEPDAAPADEATPTAA